MIALMAMTAIVNCPDTRFRTAKLMRPTFAARIGICKPESAKEFRRLFGWSIDYDWNGFAEERAEIADFISENNLAPQLLMVSGDAHMVALDDGTNSDYSSNGGAAFPVLHAAALDRPGSMKGGPYSHGAFLGGGQFGHLEVLDDGDRLEVVVTGRNWRNEVLVRFDKVIAS